jgi:N-acetylmuramoyl-L-alanine amidase
MVDRDFEIKVTELEPNSRAIKFPTSVKLGPEPDAPVVHGVMGFRTETVKYFKEADMPAATTPEQKRITEVFYLAFVLWREARAEPKDGKIALVWSILNRVTHPKWWGTDIVSVITKPWQYSSMTDPHDPQLIKYPGSQADTAWPECIDVAMGVYDGTYKNPVPGADSYYAVSMDKAGNPPDWAKKFRFVAQIANHKFYDSDGDHPENVKV